jgi:phage terminase large subunit
MLIRFKCGSTWQVIGSDNYDALVGSPPVGVVFSEWALSNPQAWSLIRPILAENGGWAIFITTPRGRNHAHRMYRDGGSSESGSPKGWWPRRRACSRRSA